MIERMFHKLITRTRNNVGKFSPLTAKFCTGRASTKIPWSPIAMKYSVQSILGQKLLKSSKNVSRQISSSGSPSASEAAVDELPSVTDLIDPEVQLMIHGEGYKPKPLRSWRRCPLIQASRKAEFRPFPDGVAPEIRHLPEHVRESLNGCKLFQPQQIAEYNRMLRQDGKLVSGVDVLANKARIKPGRLYHKFDSLCALATSKAGRLLLVQHRNLPHVFYAICYDPAHKLYIEWLNMYERRWFAVSSTYGKDDRDSSWRCFSIFRVINKKNRRTWKLMARTRICSN